MFTILAILLACEKPQPLPPRRNEMEIANTRMVQMTDFRGYLHRPAKTKYRQAVLIQVDQIDAAARQTVSGYPHQTLLIVDTQHRWLPRPRIFLAYQS